MQAEDSWMKLDGIATEWKKPEVDLNRMMSCTCINIEIIQEY